MKALALILSFASIPTFASALPAAGLPAPIFRAVETAALNGTCEERWAEIADGVGIIAEDVDRDMTLYLIPCAQWAHNLAWVGFVTLEEPKHVDGFLTLPIRFVDYTSLEGLAAKDVIHNIEWDPDLKIVRARFFMNGKEQCGSIGEYKWDFAQRTLLLQTLLKQDVCEGAPGPWETLYKR